MSLAVTFPFNILIGLPLYLTVMERLANGIPRRFVGHGVVVGLCTVARRDG